MGVARRRTAIAVAALLMALAVGAAWTLGAGHQLLAVRSGSMSPTLATGDLVVTSPPTSLEIGDIITFGSGPHVTTHRVVDVTPSGLITQGDANTSEDAVPVDPATVTGEVVASATAMGYVLVFFKQPTGAPALVLALLTMVSLWGLFFPTTTAPQPTGATSAGVTGRREASALATANPAT